MNEKIFHEYFQEKKWILKWKIPKPTIMIPANVLIHFFWRWAINCRIYKQNFCLLSPAWTFSTNAEFLYHCLNEVDFKLRTLFPVSYGVFSLFSLSSMCEVPINCFPFPPTPCYPFHYLVSNWVRGLPVNFVNLSCNHYGVRGCL